jgi:F-type H+-transporting ATPase subunit epsilon
MIDKLIKFEIVTPERTVLKESIRQITLPTKQGEITILPNHIPLIATLNPGVIHLRKADDTPEVLSVSGGFVEVLSNKVVILADTAEMAEEIDIERAEEAKKRAEQTMKDIKRADLESFTTVNAIIAKELARSRAAKLWRKLKNINKSNL